MYTDISVYIHTHINVYLQINVYKVLSETLTRILVQHCFNRLNVNSLSVPKGLR